MSSSDPTNRSFKNYGFISYSRKDEREANWLHKALEGFRIPTGLPPLPDGARRPKHVRPLFRDKKDLEYRPDSFVRQIEAELPASRFLIVMCSPNAAQSHPDGRHYVDWEIRQFIQAHGSEYARSHILPVVLAGKPGCGDPRLECLPPALLEFGPTFLEHNFPVLTDLPEDRREQKEAREDCVIGCVAFLLGVDRRVIRDRYLTAQRERMRQYMALAAAVALSLAGLAVWAFVERGRAVTSALETRATLARADFDEASRRLDDRRDTSLALAYLGNSLSRQSYPPAESRLQDLILHRSWLVEREAVELKAGKNETVVVSPALSLAPGQIRLRVSSGGKFALLQNSDGGLELVRTADGQRVGGLAPEAGWRWKGEPTEPVLLVFAPDESAVFVVDRQGDTETAARGSRQARPRVRLRGYGTADWRELLRVEQEGDIGHLVCAPDAAFVIYSYSANGAEDWRLILHSFAPGIEAWDQRVPKDPGQLSVSPDGCSLAVVDGSTVAIRSPYEGGVLRSASRLLPADIHELVFSHDARRLAYVTKSPEVGVIDVETGEVVFEPRRLGERVMGLAFGRDDSVLLVQTEKLVRRFGLQASPLAPRLIKPASQFVLQQVAADPAGHGLALVSMGREKQGAVELRTAEGGVCAPPSFLDEAANAVAFSPDGKRLAVGAGAQHGSDGGSLWLFDVPETVWAPETAKQGERAAKPLVGRRIAVPAGMVRGVRFSPDGRLVLLDLWRSDRKGAQIALVDVATGSVLPKFVVHPGGVNAAVFGPDGRLLVTIGADRVVRIWDVDKRQRIANEVRLESFPESVDISPDGTKIVVGGRFLNALGELLVLSNDGRALWPKSREFMSGVQKVRFSPDGATIAVGFSDNTVVVFDAARGRPRSDVMEHSLPVAELNFLVAEGRLVLAVACGNLETHQGYVQLWDSVSGRRLSEREPHSNAVRGVESLARDRYVSWATSGAIVSSIPRTMAEAEWKAGLLPAVAASLGGWQLNEWRAPELVDTRPGQRPAGLPTQWATLLDWMAAPVESRSMEPGGVAKLAERLKSLVTKGSLAEYRQVLDLQPDHPTAMAEYWFTLARETAEAASMAEVKDRPREGRVKRQMEWAQLSGAAKADRIFANPKAKRLADFWTTELCAKHPELALSWQERGTFLRLVGREAEAAVAVEKALELGGGDFAAREQLALLKAQQGDFAGAAEQFDKLCDWLEKNPPSGDDALGTVAKAGQNRLHFATVGRGMENVARDVRWIVDNVIRALTPIPRLSREQGNQLLDASEKLTDFLARFDGGPALSVEAHARLLEALKGKSGTTNFETVQATLLGHRAFAEILCRDTATALRDLGEAERICPDLAMGLQVWRAHALAIEGHADEARTIYETMLELDAEMAGALSKELALDFQRLQRRGIALRGLDDLRRRVFERVATQPNGILVVFALRPGDQAENAGIRVGDRLVSYAGEPVLDWEWFVWERQIESRQGLREPRAVVVLRDGRQMTFELTAGRLGLGAKTK